MSKLGIIGAAGTIGAGIAFYTGLHTLFGDIVLVDIKENIVKNHAMDMGQALSEISGTGITVGNWNDLESCDVVILAAGVPESGVVASRNAFLEGNLNILRAIGPLLSAHCKNAMIVNAMNPVDIFAYAIGRLEGLSPERIVGFCRNDSLRLRWAVGKILSVPVKDVEAYVIGEHGGTQVPLFSTVKVRGARYIFNAQEKTKITESIRSWFQEFQALDARRSSGWTSATSMYQVLEAIMTKNTIPMTGSVLCNGEYGGVKNVCLGLPLLFSSSGYKIVQLKITDEEMAAFIASAGAVKAVMQTCKIGG